MGTPGTCTPPTSTERLEPPDSSGRLAELLSEAEARRRGERGLFFFPVHRLLTGADYYPIDGHINAAGHARVADALATFIEEQSLLNRVP